MNENFMEQKREINQQMVGREQCFYWQTDRDSEPREAGEIWADRHRYFTDEKLIATVNENLDSNPIVSLVPLDYDAQTSLGNVNSVRIGVCESGQEVIIRNHPTGIENGYFHAESLASHIAKKMGVPSYDTIAIHDLKNVEDHSFQVIEKISGIALTNWIAEHPESEERLLQEVGKTMATLHKTKVEGFGPFDNTLAKKGELKGLHATYEMAVQAGLDFNLDVLQGEELFTQQQTESIKELFTNNELLENNESVLIHNDFADWNLLTDGEKITGVIDFDECVGGDPVSDIACWSTFFDPERMEGMLDGYWSVAKKPDDFQEKFELLRLRYTISKMTLRIRRYGWDPSETMKEKIEIGKIHLEESLKYFKI